MGRPLYSTQTQITAVAAEERVNKRVTFSGVLAVGQTQSLYIYAEEGTILECNGLQIYVANFSAHGATSGKVRCIVYNEDLTDSLLMLKAEYPHNLYTEFLYGEWVGAPVAEAPSSKEAQQLQSTKLIATETHPIRFDLTNVTDQDVDLTSMTYRYCKISGVQRRVK